MLLFIGRPPVLGTRIAGMMRKFEFLIDGWNFAIRYASTPLSEQSLQEPVRTIPNFTNGKYKNHQPAFVLPAKC